MSSHLPSREDGVLISYVITWESRALLLGKNIFQVPMYASYKNVLAYSDPFLSTGILNIPFIFFTSNSVLTSNLHLVFGTFIFFIAMMLLCIALFDSFPGALLSALTATFSEYHFHYLVHLHTYLLAGVPLCLLFALLWKRTSSLNALVLAAVSFLYQALNAPMTAFFLFFILLPFLSDKSLRVFLLAKKKIVFLLSISVLSLCTVFYLPYFQVSREFHYTRTIRDTAHFAHSLNIFFHVQTLFLGVICVLFLLTSRQTPKQRLPRIFLAIVGIGALFMLGPVLKINDQTFKFFSLPIPLPYALAYYIIPGFKAFRDVSRWIVVFGFGISLLSGYLLSRSSIDQRIKYMICVVFALLYFQTQVPFLQTFPIPHTLPHIYATVPKNSKNILAEFPAYSWRMMPYASKENDRLLYQLTHHQVLFNGVTGFTPPDREKDLDWLWKTFPSPEAFAYLKKQGVTHIIVHFDEYQTLTQNHYVYAGAAAPAPLQLARSLATYMSLQRLDCQERACAYKIL